MKNTTNQTVLRPALLADFEVHHHNQARDEFKKLERIITNLIIPALGQQHPVSKSLKTSDWVLRISAGNTVIGVIATALL